MLRYLFGSKPPSFHEEQIRGFPGRPEYERRRDEKLVPGVYGEIKIARDQRALLAHVAEHEARRDGGSVHKKTPRELAHELQQGGGGLAGLLKEAAEFFFAPPRRR